MATREKVCGTVWKALLSQLREETGDSVNNIDADQYFFGGSQEELTGFRLSNGSEHIYFKINGHPHYCAVSYNVTTGQVLAASDSPYRTAPAKYTDDVTNCPEIVELINKIENKKENTMALLNTLFEVKETKKMGLYVATNRKGEFVLEMKDTGDYVAFAEDSLEEVIPYSYGVKFVGGNNTQYNYFGTEGSVELGDYLMGEDGIIVVVTALDTKSRKANKAFKGRKLVTTEI